jgi:hypothetical protein
MVLAVAGDREGTEVEDADRRLEAIGSLRAGTAELLRLGHAGRLEIVEPLRVHVPDLAVDARCLVSAVHRALPQLALFESLEDYISFAERSEGRTDRSLDLGIPLLALTLHRLPPSVRRWRLRGRDAAEIVPRVTCVDRDGATRAASPSELLVMAACCRGLAAFLRRRGDPSTQREGARPVTLLSQPVVHVDIYRGRLSHHSWTC